MERMPSASLLVPAAVTCGRHGPSIRIPGLVYIPSTIGGGYTFQANPDFVPAADRYRSGRTRADEHGYRTRRRRSRRRGCRCRWCGAGRGAAPGLAPGLDAAAVAAAGGAGRGALRRSTSSGWTRRWTLVEAWSGWPAVLRRLLRSDRKGAEIFWSPGIPSRERNAGADCPPALTRAARFRPPGIWCSPASTRGSSFIAPTMATSSWTSPRASRRWVRR